VLNNSKQVVDIYDILGKEDKEYNLYWMMLQHFMHMNLHILELSKNTEL